MNPTEEFFNRIKEAEGGSPSGLKKIFRKDLTITATSDYGPFPRLAPGITSHTFGQSAGYKIAVLTVLGLCALNFGYQLYSASDGRGSGSFLLMIVFALLFMGCFYNFFIDQNTNFAIHPDSNGITVKGALYAWGDIHETAILCEHGGRGSHKTYLLLAMNDLVMYEKFELAFFVRLSGTEKKLAGYIDYFRPKPASIDKVQASAE